jgi:hypothetical protein
MRRDDADTVTMVVYLDSKWEDQYSGIWTVEAEPGASILYNVVDKPHRVSWLLHEDPDDRHLGGRLISHRPLPPAARRRRPAGRSGRRRRRRVHVGAGYLLPRKFRRWT